MRRTALSPEMSARSRASAKFRGHRRKERSRHSPQVVYASMDDVPADTSPSGTEGTRSTDRGLRLRWHIGLRICRRQKPSRPLPRKITTASALRRGVRPTASPHRRRAGCPVPKRRPLTCLPATLALSLSTAAFSDLATRNTGRPDRRSSTRKSPPRRFLHVTHEEEHIALTVRRHLVDDAVVCSARRFGTPPRRAGASVPVRSPVGWPRTPPPPRLLGASRPCHTGRHLAQRRG